MSRARPWVCLLEATVFGMVVFALSPSHASGYLLASGGFSDGYDSFAVNLPAGRSESTGPSIRLLTNSTVLQGTMVVTADPAITNLSLRFGSSLFPFYTHPGNLSAPVFVNLDVAALNDAIASALLVDPIPPTADATVFIGADGPGFVNLSEPRVTIQLANPVRVEFEIAPTTPIVVQEGGAVMLNFTEDREPGDAPPNVDWFVDGQRSEMNNNRSNSFIEFNYTSAGNHTISVVVWRGAEGVNATWPIHVEETNRVPFAAVSPSRRQAVGKGQSITFVASVHDPDGDSFTWRWLLDGAVVAGATINLTLSSLSPGDHAVELNATDGKGFVVRVVSIRSYDNPPHFVDPEPIDLEIHVAEGSSLTFEAMAWDPDGDYVSDAWFLDGQPIGTTPTVTLSASQLSAGMHMVRVVANSTDLQTERSWTVHVERRSASYDIFAALSSSASLMAFGAAVGVLAAVVVYRRWSSETTGDHREERVPPERR